MDQTNFTANQEILQAPPQLDLPPDQQPVKKHTQKRNLLTGLAVVTFCLLTAAALLSRQPTTPTSTPPLQFAPQTTTHQTEFGIKFQNLKTQVTAADPTKTDLTPPPVEYNIVLEQQR